MSSAFIDFESRSESDIRRSGASKYTKHESTVPLCLAIEITGGPEVLWLPDDPMPECLKQVVESGGTLNAFNAAFEKAFWDNVMVPKYGWPEVKLTQWRCSAARCARLALPRSLAGVGEALGLDIQKDDHGHRVMLKLCKPRKPSKNNQDRYFNGKEDFATLYKYCKQDVKAERAIHEATPDSQRIHELMWWMNQRINERGIPMDRELIENVIATDEEYNRLLLRNLDEITRGFVRTVCQRDKLMAWLHSKDVEIAGTTKLDISEALKREEISTSVRKVLEIRQLLSRTSTKKFVSMLERMEDDDRIRGEHLFHGASTGRFAGMGVQVQNLPRPSLDQDEILNAIELVKTRDPFVLQEMFGNPAAAMVSMIRSAIKAPEGSRFIVCDFAGIEARIMGWLAKEPVYQSAFSSGEDLYVEMARRIFNIKGEVSKGQRQIGKASSLGLQYGLGNKRFPEAAWGTFGVRIPDEDSKKIVNFFRTACNRIVSWWRDLGISADKAVKNKDIEYSARGIQFKCDSKFLYCRLPSGRVLSYQDPKIRMEETPIGKRKQLVYWGTNSVTKKWEEKRIWGSKWSEHVCQAVGADLLVEAIFRLENAGYPVVFHVHDEPVVEVPNGFGSVMEVERIMCDSPSWADGCLIEAEGFESERYRK